MMGHLLEVPPLHVKRRHPRSSGRVVDLIQASIMAHRPDGFHGFGEDDGINQGAVFDGVEDQRGGSDLQESLQLTSVCVADDHVQPSVS